MCSNYSVMDIPRSRVPTFDIFAVGRKKNHVAALLEIDVSTGRDSIKKHRKDGVHLSFTAWVICAIAQTLHNHPQIASYRKGKRKQCIFENINIAMIAEKTIENHQVPMPFIMKHVETKSAMEITEEIKKAVNTNLGDKDIVINKKPSGLQKMYHIFPSTIRRLFWKFLLNRPQLAYKTMGNVSVTSLSSAGKVNGWFIHSSVHPVSFGLGAVIKKPQVINNQIEIREIMNLTILLDHDVVDGMPMSKFVKDLTQRIESAEDLD
jgi:pyruvate/2-oxoglutarate dehydrogenase complex dihydrolipoamide acyltransferase (E2) component